MLFDKMSADMVKAMIECIPAEVTVIDANDEVVGWNKHETRLFRRPMEAMGMNFRQCHPEKSLAMVEKRREELTKLFSSLPVRGPFKQERMDHQAQLAAQNQEIALLKTKLEDMGNMIRDPRFMTPTPELLKRAAAKIKK